VPRHRPFSDERAGEVTLALRFIPDGSFRPARSVASGLGVSHSPLVSTRADKRPTDTVSVGA